MYLYIYTYNWYNPEATYNLVIFRDLRYSNNAIRGFTVRVGTGLLETDGQEVSVLKVIDHPVFLSSFPVGFDYDISLLYLERDLTFSTTVQPIRMLEIDEVWLIKFIIIFMRKSISELSGHHGSHCNRLGFTT